MNNPIKVLVVDDSYFMRRVICEILETDPQLQVVGTASNGVDGLKMVKSLQPDVVTLDIDMPGMGGMSVIRHIMIQCPVPIVVFSSLFCYGDVTFDSLELGVIDFVPKPSGLVSEDKHHLHSKIVDRVKNASGVSIGNIRRANSRKKSNALSISGDTPCATLNNIITVGAGLSGTNTVIRLVSQLSPVLPAAMVVMLEIAPQILPSFVKKFNERVHWDVSLIEEGQVVKPGVCYIGSNENAARVGFDSTNEPCFFLEGEIADPINILFESSARIFNHNTIGVLLTGLGDDGAGGFSRIQICNGVTIAQDTDCCVFPNLTQNAIRMGTVTQVVDENHLPVAIESYMAPAEKKKVA